MYCFWPAKAISAAPSRSYAGLPYAITSVQPVSCVRHRSRSRCSAARRSSGTSVRYVSTFTALLRTVRRGYRSAASTVGAEGRGRDCEEALALAGRVGAWSGVVALVAGVCAAILAPSPPR